MRLHHVLFATVGLATTLPALGADLTGKVVLRGTPPAEKMIDMGADPKCGALHDKPITTRHYVVAPDGGLANVLVFVKGGLTEKNFPASTETPLLDQVGCEYTPYVTGLRTQQKIKIKNSDPTLHNVHAIPNSLQSKGTANKEFNLAQPVKDMVTEKSFDAPEVAVKFKCDVHPWMFAYVGVFDHPFYAVTGKDGTFKISGLPNGKYTLEAYHVKTHGPNPGVTQEITVDGSAKADFAIELK
jgi:hypothetical protein